MELDPTLALASRTIVADEIMEPACRKSARAHIELTAARADTVAPDTAIVWEDDIPSNIRQREEGVLRADLSVLARDARGTQRAPQSGRETTRDKFTANIKAQNDLLAITS